MAYDEACEWRLPVAALFRDAGDLGNAVLDLDRGGVPLWHLGFLNAAMARARRFEVGPVLFGAYPEGESPPGLSPPCGVWSSPIGGDILSREEAQRVWEQRFFPASPLGPIPRPGRAFVRNRTPSPTLLELERSGGVAIQGSVPGGERWRSWLSTQRRGARAL